MYRLVPVKTQWIKCMKKAIVLLTTLIICLGCYMKPAGKNSDKTFPEKISVGVNLAPYEGKLVQFTGTVSNTKYPSIGDYWITAFELEDYRGKEVTVTGTVYKKEESSRGGFVQGRDGIHYYIKIKEIRELP